MNSENVLELDDINWEKAVEKGKKPVVVMFASPTCPYCRQMEPSFEQYAEEFKDKILFARFDISRSFSTASRYGVMGTPTFKFFCHGKPVGELVGAFYPSLIKKTIEETLERGPKCIENTTWIDSSISGYA